jgi:hypothetical protein
MTTPATTEAWRYCDAARLAEPATVQMLVQAVLGTFLTVRQARTKINPAEIGTAVDWLDIERKLQAALKAAGHPAGDVGGRP